MDDESVVYIPLQAWGPEFSLQHPHWGGRVRHITGGPALPAERGPPPSPPSMRDPALKSKVIGSREMTRKFDLWPPHSHVHTWTRIYIPKTRLDEQVRYVIHTPQTPSPHRTSDRIYGLKHVRQGLTQTLQPQAWRNDEEGGYFFFKGDLIITLLLLLLVTHITVLKYHYLPFRW